MAPVRPLEYTPAMIGGPAENVKPLIERLERSDALNPEERQMLSGLIDRTIKASARTMLARAHEPSEHSQLLLDGFVCRQTELADGRRQILAIHVPGDFLDLHSLLLKSLDHDVVALTPVRIGLVEHSTLKVVTAEQPHLTRLLWFLTAVDAAIHREWIASLGRSAAGRVAHLFCELKVRLEVVGLANDAGYALPLTQVDIADATSLTPVHVNRTLRQLREEGLVDFRSGRVEIGRLDALIRLADFDPAYLYLKPVAR